MGQVNCNFALYIGILELLYLTFREFIAVCGVALDLNGRLIESNQIEYQENMRQNFREMTNKLSDILGEQVCASVVKISMIKSKYNY